MLVRRLLIGLGVGRRLEDTAASRFRIYSAPHLLVSILSCSFFPFLSLPCLFIQPPPAWGACQSSLVVTKLKTFFLTSNTVRLASREASRCYNRFRLAPFISVHFKSQVSGQAKNYHYRECCGDKLALRFCEPITATAFPNFPLLMRARWRKPERRRADASTQGSCRRAPDQHTCPKSGWSWRRRRRLMQKFQ